MNYTLYDVALYFTVLRCAILCCICIELCSIALFSAMLCKKSAGTTEL